MWPSDCCWCLGSFRCGRFWWREVEQGLQNRERAGVPARAARVGWRMRPARSQMPRSLTMKGRSLPLAVLKRGHRLRNSNMSNVERKSALRFIVALGFVSLFADMTYEGAHSVIGPLLRDRSEEHTSELQSLAYLVCRLLLEKK